MPHQQYVLRAAICAATLCISISCQAMSYYKNDGVLKISGAADQTDIAKLKGQLTSDVETIIVVGSINGSWAVARDLATLVEEANVTTVTQGACQHFVCPMIFLSGKERMFSSVMRPEVTYVGLSISTSHFPEGGDDSRRPWLDVTTWWRSHTNLERSDMWPKHAAVFRPAGILPAENMRFFHPSAQTSKGAAIECFGDDQSFPKCVRMKGDQDALTAGIITTEERFVPKDPQEILRDMATPTPTAFAKLDELPIRVEKLNDNCNKTYETFLTNDSPRAFVVSSGGGCYYASAQIATPYKTAMENCKKTTTNQSSRMCRFYAVDDNVVFTDFAMAEPAVGGPAALVLGPDNAALTLERSPSSSAKDLADTFDLISNITLVVAFNWEPVSKLGGRQQIEARWFNGDQQVHRSRSTNDLGSSPSRISFRPKLLDLGTGSLRVDVYANGNFVGSKNLTIRNKLSTAESSRPTP